MSHARLAALRQRHHAARALAEACLAALSATVGEAEAAEAPDIARSRNRHAARLEHGRADEMS